jgi:hypothetical protein
MSLRAIKRPIVAAPQTVHGLNVPYYAQQQTNWCWATCVQMVIKYFNPGSTATQCQIANAGVNRTDCCTNPAPCNFPMPEAAIQPFWVHMGMTHTQVAGANVSFAGLQGAINANQPVEVGFSWTTGGGHVVLVVGWNDQNSLVAVSDPWHGQAWMTYAQMAAAYGAGQWVQTWFVSP